MSCIDGHRFDAMYPMVSLVFPVWEWVGRLVGFADAASNRSGKFRVLVVDAADRAVTIKFYLLLFSQFGT